MRKLCLFLTITSLSACSSTGPIAGHDCAKTYCDCDKENVLPAVMPGMQLALVLNSDGTCSATRRDLGNPSVEGGWIDLPEGLCFSLHGFGQEVSKIGFGSE